MKILHMSDFHYSSEKDATVLKELANHIKQKKIEIDYIAHTGDFVDAKLITERCRKKIVSQYNDLFGDNIYNADSFFVKTMESPNADEIVSAFNDALKKEYETEFTKVLQCFTRFINSIGVEHDRLAICCGNHDKMRMLKNGKSKCDNPHNQYTENPQDTEIAFKPFNNFRETITGTSGTSFFEMDDVIFWAWNSNWTMPDGSEANKSRACMNCPQLIREKKDLKNDKRPVIVLCHKPKREICENFVYDWNNSRTTDEMLDDDRMILYLCGDKHAVKEEAIDSVRVYTCGAPLSSRSIKYALITIDDDKHVTCEYLSYNGEKWDTIPVSSTMKELYSLSSKFIHKESWELISGICGNKIEVHSDWEKAIDVLHHFVSDQEFGGFDRKIFTRADASSEFFRCFCTYKRRGEERVPFGNGDFFHEILDRINMASGNVLNIRGRSNLGKSVLVGVIYLYMLYDFYKGKTNRMPALIDISLFARQDRVEEMKKFVSSLTKIKGESSTEPIIIIDGMDEQDCFGDSNERELNKIITETEYSYIVCYDTYNRFLFNRTIEHDAMSDVLYFYSVDYISLGIENKTEKFITMFIALLRGEEKAIEQKDKVIKKIGEYRIHSIDAGFLYKNLDNLIDDTNADCVGWNIIVDNTRRLKQECVNILQWDPNDEIFPKCAYLFAIRGENYKRINHIYKVVVSEETFYKIIKNRNVMDYLVATHYIKEMRNGLNGNRILPESILNCFLERRYALLVRAIMHMDNAENEFNNIHSLLDKVNCKGVSMLWYLVGHKRGNIPNKINTIQNMKKYSEECKKSKQINHSSKKNSSKKIKTCSLKHESPFWKYAADRSRDLAMIFGGTQQEQQEEEMKFLDSILNDEESRSNNRIYQLLYYGDTKINHTANTGDYPSENLNEKGFGFHNTFHTLYAKLKYALDNGKEYPLMKIDLVTLCSIILSRLSYSITSNEEPYFIRKVTREEAIGILDSMISIIDSYLAPNTFGRHDSVLKSSWYIYLNNAITIMMNCRTELRSDKEGDELQRDILKTTHPITTLDNLRKIESMNRVGWEINARGGYSESELSEKRKVSNPKERITEHIYESMCIALLYLPEELSYSEKKEYKAKDNRDYKKYDKNKVITYIFIRKLGLWNMGDYIPGSSILSNSDNESKELLKILNLYSMDGYGGMKNYYEIFRDRNDINYIIAEDIRQIQREYKMWMLKREGRLDFDEARLATFKTTFSDKKTELGRIIRENLNISNPYS